METENNAEPVRSAQSSAIVEENRSQPSQPQGVTSTENTSVEGHSKDNEPFKETNVVVDSATANQPKPSISKRRLTLDVYQPRTKKSRTELSIESPAGAESQREETVCARASSAKTSSNRRDEEGSVSISGDVFKSMNCLTCDTTVHTKLEKEYHEQYHNNNRCSLCKAYINERHLLKHFHACLLCSDRFSNDELLIYMTPFIVKMGLPMTDKVSLARPQGTPVRHPVKPGSVKERMSSAKKHKRRIRIRRAASSSSESENIITDELDPKTTAADSIQQDTEKKADPKKHKIIETKKSSDLMPSLQVNNSIKIWLNNEAQKCQLFTLRDGPKLHNSYIDLNADGATQLEKENVQISAFCLRLNGLRKQKNIPNSQTLPVTVAEKPPFRRPSTISNGFGINKNAQMVSITQRSRSVVVVNHHSPASASNRFYTPSYASDTIYDPRLMLHSNITVPTASTGHGHVFDNGPSAASSSTSVPHPHSSNNNHIAPHIQTRLNVNTPRPLSFAPIINTPFKILSPKELNMRVEQRAMATSNQSQIGPRMAMAMSNQSQNGPYSVHNFYGSNATSINPNLNPTPSEEREPIHTSLIRDKTGHLGLIFKKNDVRIEYNNMDHGQRLEVQRSLLHQGVWYQMLAHIKAGIPSPTTLHLFKEILPLAEAQIFFEEYETSRRLANGASQQR